MRRDARTWPQGPNSRSTPVRQRQELHPHQTPGVQLPSKTLNRLKDLRFGCRGTKALIQIRLASRADLRAV
jgi:hypothetical protein